jgi:phosphoribosylanthranilate isomerase
MLSTASAAGLFAAQFTTNPPVKICCIQSAAEARMAISAGASALGLVSEMPSGPGVISEELIAEIVASLPRTIATFLLTSKLSASDIIAQHRRCRTHTIQLRDRLSDGAYEALREALPDIGLVQVIHVTDEGSVAEAFEAARHVDALLLDSGNPKAPVKELGGTGRTHDWSLSRRIVTQAPVPVFLAGGLRPENVRQAFDAVRPFGLDVCNGVRNEGRLDPHKLARFMAQIGGPSVPSVIPTPPHTL